SLVEPSRVVETAFVRAREWVANAPPLTRCAIHGDFNPGNVLAVHGRPVAVLDWSAARLDWAAYDLACVVGLLALERDGSIDRDGSAPPARTRRQVPPAPPRRSPHSGRFRGREPAAPLQHRTRRATVRPTVRTGQYGPPTMRLLVARCEVLYTGRLTARLPEAV